MKGRSTNSAIYNFVGTILNNLENKNLSLGMYIDLSKECVNHEILLLILKYGIRGKANYWIATKQQIFVNGGGNEAKSKVRSIDSTGQYCGRYSI